MNKEMKQKMKVWFGVEMGNAVVDPLAVMIHAVDTNIAPSTVVVP